MNKDYLIKLTQNLYKLTLLFPKKEPLRYKMRELADEILADGLRNTKKYEYTKETDRDPFSAKLTETRSLQILERLEVLDGFFEVAKGQNWVSIENLLNIQGEYSKLREGIGKVIHKEKAPLTLRKTENKVGERQKKILEFLKEKEKAQVWEIKKILPEVSKRTLRRDFEKLVKKGLIERLGERNNTFYRLRTN
jgi:DNA-binding HxlR family transcriptional regulator